ncbi:MAG TPA: NmrA family NAD(P)-binding protein [Bryobacteraceae bacterium]|nr:NmrA family NAD(P)-binding protein [Bryobacteraceae bacterium]
MFVIAGATGNTGGVVANTLLAQGKPVTVLVRDAHKAEGLRQKGAQVATASVEDRNALAAALAGAEGAYLLIPPNYKAEDALGYSQRVADTLAGAVKDSGILHVVLLSSVGAQHAQGTGPIRGLHHAESAMRPVATNLTILRPGYFLQNWASGMEGVKSQGVLHNFLTPERKIPMISTVDIGRFAAACLTDPAHGARVLELAGPEDYSPQDIAHAFDTALGKPVKLETHPLDAVIPTLTATGFTQDLARLFREMIEGINTGHVDYEDKGATFKRGNVTALDAIKQMLGLS